MSNLADAIRASKHDGIERTMALLKESLAFAVEVDQAFRVLPPVLPTREQTMCDKYHLREIVSNYRNDHLVPSICRVLLCLATRMAPLITVSGSHECFAQTCLCLSV